MNRSNNSQSRAGTIIAAMSDTLDGEDRRLRASLVSSQIIGVAMARYIWKIGALADATPEEVVRYVAPTLQRYLTEAL